MKKASEFLALEAPSFGLSFFIFTREAKK